MCCRIELGTARGALHIQSKQLLLEQPMAAEPLCQDLRGLVHDCLAKHLYESAAFYADKLVTLSDGTPGDVYVLAQVRASAPLATCLLVSQRRLPSLTATPPCILCGTDTHSASSEPRRCTGRSN